MRCRLLLIAVLTVSPAAFAQEPDPSADQARNAWLYRVSGKDGWFKREMDKQWIEWTVNGVQFEFQEVTPQASFVELFDRSRTMWLRLYADHAEFRQGEKGAWNRLYKGHWVKADELPQVPPPDYRIRLAYFVPADREPTPNYAQKIRVVMHFVAELYRQDIAAHGIHSQGLRFQTDKGELVIHLVRSQRNAAFFNNAPVYDSLHQWRTILAEIPPSVGRPHRNVIVIFAETYDSGPWKFEWPGGMIARGSRFSADGGIGLFSAWILQPEFCAMTVETQKEMLFDTTPIKGRTALGHGQPDSPRCQFIQDGFGAVAHELGHALGLLHDTRQDYLDIMGNGFRNLRWNFTTQPDPKRRARFSDDNARILYASRYLASDLVLSDRSAPTAELSWAGPLEAGARTVRVSVTAADNEGLRAMSFYSPAHDSIIGGRALAGKKQTFEETLSVRPLQAGTVRLRVQVADVGGNLTQAELAGTVPK